MAKSKNNTEMKNLKNKLVNKLDIHVSDFNLKPKHIKNIHEHTIVANVLKSKGSNL